MPVHIDEIDTQVQVTPAPAPGGSAPAEPEWQLLARLQAAVLRLMLDESRTRARGNED